jgi:two-component SAPR family response regulator
MTRANALQDLQVLIVEDDYLVADTLMDTLREAGASILGPLGRLDAALAFVRQHGTELDGVVLDLNLHGQTTYAVADALIEAGVRFVFVTCYDAGALDAAYRGYPRCQKPFQPEAIVVALTSALADN